MREIKLRAWDKIQNEMVNFDIYNVPSYVGQTHLEGEKFERNYDIMQYTGLKDKNGVDIYEGDILKVFVLDSKGPHAKVKLKNGMFGIEDDMFGYGFYKGHYSLHQILSRYVAEVIGNIYENPELLGDSK